MTDEPIQASTEPHGGGTEPPADAPQRFRLDALAVAAGVPTSTIRLYRQRGLLHPPHLVGRTGWYDRSHLARLRLVGRLQDQGFSLAGIARLLETWEHGGALTDLVDVEAQLDGLLHGRTPVVLDASDVLARFPDGSLSPAAMQRAAELGLVQVLDDGRIRIPDRRFLEVGADLAALGVPTEVVLEEWAHLRAHTDEVAERFVDVFERHLLPERWRAGRPDADEAQRLAEVLDRLRRHAGQVLLAALDDSMARAAAERLATLTGSDEASDQFPPPGSQSRPG